MDNIQAYLLTFLIWLASIILFRAIFTKSQRKLRLPPGPMALPILGHFHLLQPPLHRAIHKLSNRYGPLIHIKIGSLPFVFVSSAEIAKEILKTQETCFCNRPANSAISYLTYNASDLAFSPYGTYWKFMKKLCMTELLNGRMLDQLLPIRQEEISRFLQIVQKKAEKGEAVTFGKEALKLTNSIIMRMAISKSCFNTEDEAHEVTEWVKETSKLSAKFNLADYFWFCKNLDLQGMGKRLKEARDKFDVMIEKIMKEHEEARKKYARKDAAKDLLDVCLSLLEHESSEVQISRENIKAFLVDIFTGGTDTTAVTIEWSLAELINHPTIMEKARNEIDSAIGKDRLVVESDVAKLPYIQAVVKETLRLHPPSPFIMRESSKNCTIAGYDIPSNTSVFINEWSVGRDPKYWDDPLKFYPERFLSKDESGLKLSNQLDVRGQSYQLLPFGSGRRGCPGFSLAMNVVQSCLAAMIQCFEWKVNGGVDMEEGPEMILTRAEHLVCFPIPRLNISFPTVSG